MVETILRDIRYGIRQLWTQRGFAFVAVLTLALALGLSTALFSIFDAAILHPLPYPHPEQLVDVSVRSQQRSGRTVQLDPSIDDVRLMRASQGVFSAVAIWQNGPAALVDSAQPERLEGYEIDEGYLGLYEVTPVIGRGIEPADTVVGAAPVVLLGYDYWQRRFGGSRDVLGQAIRFESSAATVVGVLPATFERSKAIWRPFVATPMLLTMRGSGKSVYGRLRPGVTVDQAAQQLTAALNGRPGARPGRSIALEPLLTRTIAKYRTTMNVLSGAVLLILLIACVNVSGLLLARGAVRSSELAIRVSIGASRARVVRQLLTESLLLALAGGAAGLLLAQWSLDTLVANVPVSLPSNVPVSLNLRVLGFGLALSLAVGLIFGLAPALRLSRARPELLHGRRFGSSLSRRNTSFLIGAEVALAVVLLAGAGLMLRSFDRMLAIDLGFQPQGIVTLETQTIDPAPAVVGQYYPALLDLIRARPGVAAAGAIDQLPLGGRSTVTSAQGEVADDVHVRQILPGYFEAMGLSLRSGRFPTEQDRASARRVTVINEEAAKRLFPGGSPIGRAVVLQAGTAGLEVIGVVADVRFWGPLRPTAAELYQLFGAGGDSGVRLPRTLTVVVRPAGDGRGLFADLRQAALSVGPRVLVGRVRSGDAWLDDGLVTPRQRTVLLTLLGALGLILALVGIFGMTAYTVARRRQEIGVRMAFGAQPRDVVAMMVKETARPVVIGIVLGLAGAGLATRLIRSFLFETTPTDPSTFMLVAIALGVAACLAAWIPTSRAARVDPVRALRAD